MYDDNEVNRSQGVRFHELVGFRCQCSVSVKWLEGWDARRLRSFIASGFLASRLPASLL